MALTDEEKRYLLHCAREVIRHAVLGQKPYQIDATEVPSTLQRPGATFVTLRVGQQLRGCIGSLVARRPLIEDVRQNALAAAFEDPRFSPLTQAEFENVHIELSVLSQPEPLAYDGPEDLIQKLRPGIDGVVIERGWNRATFLPQVWEQIPDPEEFLEHLCYKAHLPQNAWCTVDLQVQTYQVEKFEEGQV